MTASAPSFAFVGAIKVDPGPIPDLKPPREEIAVDVPEKAILGAVMFLAFAVLILGRVFRRPKVVVPVPPEHPAAAARRVLSQIVPNSPPAAAAADVAHALRNYLRSAFGLGAEELTTLEISDRFGTHRLANAETAARVLEFLRDCEAVQFAPADSSAPVSIADRAWTLIEELERQRTPAVSLPPPLPVAT
jgi:hypothetical protein